MKWSRVVKSEGSVLVLIIVGFCGCDCRKGFVCLLDEGDDDLIDLGVGCDG